MQITPNVRPNPTASPVQSNQAEKLQQIVNQDRKSVELEKTAKEMYGYDELPINTSKPVEVAPIVVDNPNTKLIETSWRFNNPPIQDGIMCITSVSDKVQHKFKVYEHDGFIKSVKDTLSIKYDISNLKL